MFFISAFNTPRVCPNGEKPPFASSFLPIQVFFGGCGGAFFQKSTPHRPLRSPRTPKGKTPLVVFPSVPLARNIHPFRALWTGQVFRPLRRASRGSASALREPLKRLDPNFYAMARDLDSKKAAACATCFCLGRGRCSTF